MTNNSNNQSELLLAQTVSNAILGVGAILSYWAFVRDCVAISAPSVLRSNAAVMKALGDVLLKGADVDWDHALASQRDLVLNNVSAALLVSAHARFEKSIFKLLNAVARADPSRWNSSLQNVNDNRRELRKLADTASALVGGDSSKFKKLEREGLITWINILEEIFGQRLTDSQGTDYIYDRPRIDRIDRVRHDFAHANAEFRYDHNSLDIDILFLLKTLGHFGGLICSEFGIAPTFGSNPTISDIVNPPETTFIRPRGGS